MASSERTIEAEVAELERRSRRSRMILLVGMLLIVVGLVAAVFKLNSLYREASANEKAARKELEKFKASAEVIARARAAQSPQDRLRILDEGIFGIRQVAAPERPAQVPLERLEVRIWICEGSSPVNRTQAESLRLAQPGNATGRWRRDYVETGLNARGDFRLIRNEIRYNPEEEEAADRLQRMVRDIGSDAHKVLTFYPSPNSISVFFCQGATPPPLPPEQSDPAATSNLAE